MTICNNLILSIRQASLLRKPVGWSAFFFALTLFPSVAFLLSSCSSITPTEYSSFENIPESGIPSGWEYEFFPVPADSADIGTKRFDLILVVRFNNRCASNSVIFDIEEYSLAHSEPDSTRLSIPLFKTDGSPRGFGNYGLFEVADTLRRSVTLEDGYVVALSSPLPQEQTAGINAIGIVAVPSESKPPLNGIWPKFK